jgi:hypothetical protein
LERARSKWRGPAAGNRHGRDHAVANEE